MSGPFPIRIAIAMISTCAFVPGASGSKIAARASPRPAATPQAAPTLLSPSPAAPPAISTLLKPAVYREVMEEREVMSHADLEDIPKSELKRYTFYSAMLAHASLSETRRVLTDYRLYAEMIPYVSKADYSEARKLLRIEGGIWKFRMMSTVRFEERGDRWIHYRIVLGHFSGMQGDIFFEPRGEKGTLVYMRGEHVGDRWPPAFVVEEGAEIVFGFTARRMRSYLETPPEKPKEKPTEKKPHDDEAPQPRSRL